ncbi:MAG: PEP-CTERM sorting domain-containing protein [Phycisphaerales bacterium]|nr:PEP-CTERM sorting domain-containing protein [Phycisphaerales bacterium]
MSLRRVLLAGTGEVYLGSFTVTAGAIPEPASMALLVIGSALIGFRRQR